MDVTETPPHEVLREDNHQENFLPAYDSLGRLLTTQDEYTLQLSNCRRKEPLFAACYALGIATAKNSTLEKLCRKLLDHCFPVSSPVAAEDSESSVNGTLVFGGTDEIQLATRYAAEGVGIDEVLGVDNDDDDNESDEEIEYPEDSTHGEDGDFDDVEHVSFRRRLRVDETRRAEAHRRAGGIKTQEAVVKAWEEFKIIARQNGWILDDVIDEHHLLLWIKFCAERPKKSKRGVDIPGTYIGASHLKKLYFGALRIRKKQDAEDPSLQLSRPAATVIVWDSLKTRMHEALARERNGLIPAEDAPDIVANTFLDNVTDEQLDRIGTGFLSHTHLHSAINGHLAWTGQMASGNRGDDFRALKLSELQPYTFLHPNGQTGVESVLGLQGEEKAGGRGMKTKINPVYTVFITHLEPEKCPIGAFAFYHHYIHDVKNFTETLNIDWSVNKSWRQIRVLHGPNSPTTPYNEQNLYNLYVKAFQRANFTSGIKAHLPRHILGYRQEKLGVDPADTAKMGWVRGETYFDTYAPALPKPAILAAHGYKKHEAYDPVWRHVHVPEQFLQLVCPIAEGIHAQIVGRDNLTGAANYWQMVMWSRKYVFLCGAAIYQKCPESPIFRLPALADPTVQKWMRTEFPTNLALLRANAGSPIDLERIQNESLRTALEEVRTLLLSQNMLIQALTLKLERRTAPLSPTKAFSTDLYHQRLKTATNMTPISQPIFNSTPALAPPLTPLFTQTISKSKEASPLTALLLLAEPEHQELAQADPSTGVINPRLLGPQSLEPQTACQVDLVLPPPLAFTDYNNPHAVWPPLLGQQFVPWDKVYPLVKQPHMLWECWHPHSLDTYASVEDQWIAYNTGETVVDKSGTPIGMKPPLRQVEQFFKTKWRTLPGKAGYARRKAWERFSEIPKYIENEAQDRGVSPHEIIAELDALREPTDSRGRIGLNKLMREVKEIRERKIVEQSEHKNPSADSSGEDEDIPQGLKRKRPVEIRRHQTAKRRKG